MPAFQFPASPPDYETVTNPATGASYQWRPDLMKWVLTATASSDRLTQRVEDLETNVEALQEDVERIDDKIEEEI